MVNFIFVHLRGEMVKFDNSKNVVNRMVNAYKLKTVKALCNHFDVGLSVITNRILRNSFPAEYVIQCALETGADLQWLCTGEGEPNIDGIKTEKKSIELSSEALEKLERIAALKKDNLITESEYQLLKGSIFNN
jgi:hypothetical protein